MRLNLDIREDPSGRKVLYFPFMCMSDLHWGSPFAMPAEVRQMLAHTQTDQLNLLGDTIDLVAMKKAPKWTPNEDIRQGIADILRKAGTGTIVNAFIGNHEDEVLQGKAWFGGELRPHRVLDGKTIFGVRFMREAVYESHEGKLLLIHGDKFDRRTTRNGHIGDVVRTAQSELSALLNSAGLKDKGWDAPEEENMPHMKTIMGRHLGTRKNAGDFIDRTDFAGIIIGHTHRAGFLHSPNGKPIVNCGSANHCLVRDSSGNWANLAWHKDRLEIMEPSGNREVHYWKDLGLPEFEQPAPLQSDHYTAKADRLLRLIYRAAPPADRAELVIRRNVQREILDQFRNAAGTASLSERQISLYKAASRRLADSESILATIPLPSGHHAPPGGDTRDRQACLRAPRRPSAPVHQPCFAPAFNFG